MDALPNTPIKEQIRCLRWLDTIHDFFPVTTTGARGEDIRDIIKEYYGDDVAEYIKSSLFKNSVGESIDIKGITPSSVEVQTEAFYNKYFNTMMVDSQSSVNIKTVIDKYEINDARTVLTNLGISETSEQAKLQLCLTDREFLKDPAKKQATNFLAEVIRRFFFSSTEKPIYFLIDATFGRLDCMFQGIDGETGTIINALTIGDSAVTSTADKKGKKASKSCEVNDNLNPFKKKIYFDGDNTLPYNDRATKRYDITSNEFSKDKFKVWYKDAVNVFSRTENASIRFFCQRTSNPAIEWYTEFSILQSGSPNSGASVGVLKQLIIILNGLTEANRDFIKTSISNHYKNEGITSLNLSPIICGMIGQPDITKEDIINFLFDYKRGGDHEQVNSAFYLNSGVGIQGDVVLLTGDRLCSLYARLMKQPCIYVHDDNYDMYRYLKGLTPVQIAANNAILFKITQDKIIGKLNEYSNPVLFTELDNRNITDMKDRINAYLASINEADDFYSKLYKISFRCLLQKLDRISILINTLSFESTELLDEINQQTLDPNPINVPTQIAHMNLRYNSFLSHYKELLNYLEFKDESLPLEINTKNVSKFKSSAVGYDNKLFNNVRSYFDNFEGAIKAPIRLAARDANVQIAIKRNKILGWGGGNEYICLLNDFEKFINKCKDDGDKVITEAPMVTGEGEGEEEMAVDEERQSANELVATAKLTEIQAAVNLILNNQTVGYTISDQTYISYAGIKDIIETYLLTKIPTELNDMIVIPVTVVSEAMNTTPVIVTASPGQGQEQGIVSPGPDVSTEMNISPVITSNTVFGPEQLPPDVYAKKEIQTATLLPDDDDDDLGGGGIKHISGGGKILFDTLFDVNETILKDQNEKIQSIKNILISVNGKRGVDRLFNKLKKEYELYFNDRNEVDNNDNDMNKYIANYLKKYIEELIIAHSDTLINACSEIIYDITDSDLIVDTYEKIYHAIYNLIDKRYKNVFNNMQNMLAFMTTVHIANTQLENDRIELQREELQQLIEIKEKEIERQAQMLIQNKPGTGKFFKTAKNVGNIATTKRVISMKQRLLEELKKKPANKTPVNIIRKKEHELNLLKDELKQLEGESVESVKPVQKEKKEIIGLPVIPEESSSTNASVQPSTLSFQRIPGMGPNVRSVLNRRLSTGENIESTGERSATIRAKQGNADKEIVGVKRSKTGEGTYNRIYYKGGRHNRSRKYVNKKKKKSRKLNKRLKKNITKHNKYKVKKYTRKHYKM